MAEPDERRYTLAEAKLELNRVECRELGHDWGIELEDSDMQVPVAVTCNRCGRRWPVERGPDREALDKLNLLLSASTWPGASALEDVCAIVRATGRSEVEDAPAWEAH